MRSVDEHLAAILEALPGAAPVPAPLDAALGLVVAADVAADVDLPGFDNSSMDGYAVQSASLDG
ncbi:MAG: molybdopterin molybdenumtransferase MoeA, partial [Micrococcales bacterium]|nr:molybdopterin molybdenumtransferase MoeA [Micrococcales bacterium]